MLKEYTIEGLEKERDCFNCREYGNEWCSEDFNCDSHTKIAWVIRKDAAEYVEKINKEIRYCNACEYHDSCWAYAHGYPDWDGREPCWKIEKIKTYGSC